MSEIHNIEYGKPVITLVDDTGKTVGGWLHLLDISEYFKKAEEKLGEGKAFTLYKAWRNSDGEIEIKSIGGKCVG